VRNAEGALVSEALSEVNDPAPDPGLFGPHSVTWQLHADPAIWLSGIASLYLQALHPLVVSGTVQNSNFLRDPLGRLSRTVGFLGLATYGASTDARRAAARIRHIHRTLKGRDPATSAHFALDDPELLLWVHCAEVGMHVRVLPRAGFPLTAAQADRYLDEQRVSAELVGLDPARVPGSRAELAAYFDSMLPRLRASPDSEIVYRFLQRPPLSGVLKLALAAYQPMIGQLCYSLLPEWALSMYGRRPYPAWFTTQLLRTARTAGHAVPRSIRWGKPHPHTLEAIDRLGEWATPSPDRLPRS
jgi:uncharacterized protein (DUF2236 family)